MQIVILRLWVSFVLCWLVVLGQGRAEVLNCIAVVVAMLGLLRLWYLEAPWEQALVARLFEVGRLEVLRRFDVLVRGCGCLAIAMRDLWCLWVLTFWELALAVKQLKVTGYLVA